MVSLPSLLPIDPWSFELLSQPFLRGVWNLSQPELSIRGLEIIFVVWTKVTDNVPIWLVQLYDLIHGLYQVTWRFCWHRYDDYKVWASIDWHQDEIVAPDWGRYWVDVHMNIGANSERWLRHTRWCWWCLHFSLLTCYTLTYDDVSIFTSTDVRCVPSRFALQVGFT